VNTNGGTKCPRCGDFHGSGPVSLARCEAAQRRAASADAITKVDAAPKREGKVDRHG
jgi:hypothetical protein